MKKYLLTSLALTGLTILPALSLAATPEPGTFTLTPQIGGYFFEGNQDLDDNIMFGLAPGYFFTRELAAELVIQYIDTETDFSSNNKDIDGWLYHVDLLYHFSPDNRLVPFIAAGVGGISVHDTPEGNDSSVQVNYGAGLKYALTENLDLRGDIRHMISFDDHVSNLAALVGLTYNFNQSVQPAPEPIQKLTPVAPAPIVLDSDGDGILDNLDQCPDTPTNLMVDAQGCPITEEISVDLRVKFDHDKANVKANYDAHCRKVADFLTTFPNATAIIEGHTDSTGSEEYNQQLSQQRAESVRQYFIDNFSIAPERLQAKGFGETSAIATNDTEAGRQDNRRVVATITTMRTKTK